METFELYQDATAKDISIMILGIPENGSMCIQTETRCYIGMDYDVIKNEADCRVHLAHELGHCATGSFYNRWAARDLREKHEHRADKWAITRLVPHAALDKAVESGIKEAWSLAEYFGVTEDFMKKAICFYKYGNLNPELYL